MSIYQHFRPREKGFIDQVFSWIRYVDMRYAPKLTDFLDPREQHIVQSVVRYQDLCNVSFFGGAEQNERRRAILYPNYLEVTEDDFSIALFEIIYPDNFVTIAHPQVLGSLLGSGVKRSKFGDIIIRDERIQFFVAKEIAEYIQLNVDRIGKTAVTLKQLPLVEALEAEESWQELVLSVSSLRLDAVLSGAHNLSRQKAREWIQRGLVKVNWEIVEEPDYQLEEHDVISARRLGRIKIFQLLGQTKKEKWRILVGKQK